MICPTSKNYEYDHENYELEVEVYIIYVYFGVNSKFVVRYILRDIYEFNFPVTPCQHSDRVQSANLSLIQSDQKLTSFTFLTTNTLYLSDSKKGNSMLLRLLQQKTARDLLACRRDS